MDGHPVARMGGLYRSLSDGCAEGEGRKRRSKRYLERHTGVCTYCMDMKRCIEPKADNLSEAGPTVKSRFSAEFGGFQDLICCQMRHDYPYNHDVI